MITGWLVAAALTFAASVHCVGMCGGFVLAAGAARSGRWAPLADHLLLQLGKAATYLFLGALAGLLGRALVAHPLFTWTGRVLAVLAGLAIVLAGLTLLGLRGRGVAAPAVAPLLSRITGPLLGAKPAGWPLVVGMVMGFLPCPLVYAGLAGAAASGSAAQGAAILGGVALGTVPALALVAVSRGLVPASAGRNLARAGGVLLLVVGAVTLARGVGLHAGHGAHGTHGTEAHGASDCCVPSSP